MYPAQPTAIRYEHKDTKAQRSCGTPVSSSCAATPLCLCVHNELQSVEPSILLPSERRGKRHFLHASEDLNVCFERKRGRVVAHTATLLVSDHPVCSALGTGPFC